MSGENGAVGEMESLQLPCPMSINSLSLSTEDYSCLSCATGGQAKESRDRKAAFHHSTQIERLIKDEKAQLEARGRHLPPLPRELAQ